jgi:NTP pyrophosphatase (non-canonical NTP hydrolase)
MVKRNYIQNDFDSILGHLVEECGEVLAAAGKTMRWGPDSYNPELPKDQRETNIAWLRREVADLESVIARAKEYIFDEEDTNAVA